MEEARAKPAQEGGPTSLDFDVNNTPNTVLRASGSGGPRDKEPTCQCKRLGFDPLGRVRRFPGEEDGNPPVILTWAIPWTEEFKWATAWGCKELAMTEHAKLVSTNSLFRAEVNESVLSENLKTTPGRQTKMD